MKLLAIETATEACSAALYLDGEVCEEFRLAPRQHATLLLAMLDSLLVDAGLNLADLDAVAFGRGPGAFTGVRIATGVVQGIAFASELPVVPVSTLAALAQGAYREFGCERTAAAIDARMDEVYWASYEVKDGNAVALGRELVTPPSNVPMLEGRDWCGIGSGWLTYRDELIERQGNVVTQVQGGCYPHAQDIATLAAAVLADGRVVTAEQALPIYLRDQVVRKPSL